jgi:hypothetical protein
MERRSFLHVVRSFQRIFFALLFSMHVLLAVAIAEIRSGTLVNKNAFLVASPPLSLVRRPQQLPRELARLTPRARRRCFRC